MRTSIAQYGPHWQKVFQSPDRFTSVGSAFFFNEQRGIIGIDGVAGIWRTSDGGVSWQRSAIPAFYWGYVQDIFMKDDLNGWCAVEDSVFDQSIWRTTDGGATWFEAQGEAMLPTSVWQSANGVVYTERYNPFRRGISLSTDMGATFNQVVRGRFNGLDYVDDLHGYASPFYNYLGQYTEDGGLTWNTSDYGIEAWGVYGQKGTSNYIIAGEDVSDSQAGFSSVEKSTNYGRTFDRIANLPIRTTGHIEGVGNIMYVQAASYYGPNDGKVLGMYRSTDGGYTWKSVGGPSHVRDTRFVVLGCSGGIVYAFNLAGEVWKTVNGGDGEIHDTPMSPALTKDSVYLMGDRCSFATDSIWFSNLTCHDITIQEVAFTDSSLEVIQSGALSFMRTPPTPLVLGQSEGYFFTLKWDPTKSSQQSPSGTTTIIIRSTALDGALQLDTLILVDLRSLTSQPRAILSASNLNIIETSICDIRDTVITISNPLCDSLLITKAELDNLIGWELYEEDGVTPVQVPFGLAGGQSKKLRVRFRPNKVGSFQSSIAVTMTHDGMSRDTSISLNSQSYRVATISTLDSIDIGQVSICTSIDTVIRYFNAGCEDIRIDSLVFSGSGQIVATGLPMFPIVLKPGETLPIPIHYAPLKDIESISSLLLYFDASGDSLVISMSIRGVGTPGTSNFQTTLTQQPHDFTTRTFCDEADSLQFILRNFGCDTVEVESISWSTSSPTVFESELPSFPYDLIVGSISYPIRITAKPVTPGAHTATVTVRYRLSDNTIRDTVFTFRINVSRGEKLISFNDDQIDFGSNPLCMVRDTTIEFENTGCDTITVANVGLSNVGAFTINSYRQPPYTLPQGAKESVRILYSPTSFGSFTSDLIVTSDADNEPLKDISIAARTIDKDYVQFRLEPVRGYYTAGDSVVITVIPDIDWTGKGLKQMSFSIMYNGDLLTYFFKEHSQSLDITITENVLAGGLSRLDVSISSAQEVELRQDIALLSLHFEVKLTDTLTTDVVLSGIRLNGGDSTYENCILSTSAHDTDFTLSLLCGDRYIYDFLRNIPILRAENIYPNPVTSDNRYRLKIPYQFYSVGIVDVEIVNLEGKTLIRRSKLHSLPEHGTFDLDLSGLQSATYEYILRAGENALPVRGRFLLIK